MLEQTYINITVKKQDNGNFVATTDANYSRFDDLQTEENTFAATLKGLFDDLLYIAKKAEDRTEPPNKINKQIKAIRGEMRRLNALSPGGPAAASYLHIEQVGENVAVCGVEYRKVLKPNDLLYVLRNIPTPDDVIFGAEFVINALEPLKTL